MFRCYNCGSDFDLPIEKSIKNEIVFVCPYCHSNFYSETETCEICRGEFLGFEFTNYNVCEKCFKQWLKVE